jgi:hypothetical protein
MRVPENVAKWGFDRETAKWDSAQTSYGSAAITTAVAGMESLIGSMLDLPVPQTLTRPPPTPRGRILMGWYAVLPS